MKKIILIAAVLTLALTGCTVTIPARVVQEPAVTVTIWGEHTPTIPLPDSTGLYSTKIPQRFAIIQENPVFSSIMKDDPEETP